MGNNTDGVGTPTRIRSVDSENLEAVSGSSSSSFAAPLASVPVDGAVDLPADGQKAKKQKICCVCGKNVAGEERFKDHSGRYWCMDCGTEDNRKKAGKQQAVVETLMCPDCKQTFPAGQMVEYDHVKLCVECEPKREKAAKREAARKAAAEEAAREAEQKWKMMMVGATVLAVVAVAWAIYAIVG